MEALERVAKKAIENRVFPGCVMGVISQDGERKVMAMGRVRYDERAPEVNKDTIYDMASVTKSIPLASLVLSFIAEGKLLLEDSVKKYLPELENDYDATIEDLLRYRVKGPRMATIALKTFEEIRTHILEKGFDGPPGKEKYSNIPAFLLGLIVERVGNAILPALAEEYFFDPLGMKDTTFFPHDIERIAPTEIVDGKEIRGTVHDESARVFAHARRAVGHAGLFSTAPDMLNFLDALLQGKYPAIVDGAEKGLGWHLSQSWFMGKQCGGLCFGKTGFTGTSVACDVQKGIGLVILSNRTYPTRPEDAMSLSSAINRFRSEIADVVFG